MNISNREFEISVTEIPHRKEVKLTPYRFGAAQTPSFLEGPEVKYTWEIVQRLRSWANSSQSNTKAPFVFQPLTNWDGLTAQTVSQFDALPPMLHDLQAVRQTSIYGDPYMRIRRDIQRMPIDQAESFFSAIARHTDAEIGFVNGQYAVWVDLQAEASFRVTLDFMIAPDRRCEYGNGRFQIIAHPIDPR